MLSTLYAVFFASGFAALLYQVIWQRMLALFSGADVFSVTLIVAAFMGGLGCGNLVGGSIADRLGRRTCLALFAAAEFAVAGFALSSKWFYYDVLYARLGGLDLSPPLLAGVLFASVLWPTFFMGLSLPLLARAVVPSLHAAARTVGSLYGWNTLGAAAGALVTTWVLLRRVDFETSLRIGAALNAACGISVFAVWRGLGARATPAAEPAERDASAPIFAFGTWLAIYALSGAIALSLEIAWFRALGVIQKSTSFTFGTLLGIYLTGVASGSLVGARYADRPGRSAALRFLALQVAIAVYAALAVTAKVLAVGHVPAFASLAEYFAGYEPIEMAKALRALGEQPLGWLAPQSAAQQLARQFLVLYVAVPLLLIGPPTFLMGLSFPFLQRAVQTDARRLGRRVGWLQTANIAGSLFGSLLTGFALLPLLGTAGTFRALAAATLVFCALAFAVVGPGRAGARVALGLGAAALLAVACVPRGHVLWGALHGADPASILVVEDASGVSLLRPEADGSAHRVMAGGLGQSALPYGNLGGVHTLLGLLPVLLHPKPERVAVIGLGSGDTAYGAAGRPEVAELEVVEIVGSQLELLQIHAQRAEDPGLRALLSDPRVQIHIGDGRTHLRRAARSYDVIEADALRPTSAYAGNLYSLEYFALLRASLAPRGLAVSWVPTRRIAASFVRTFPHVLLIGDIAIGSSHPIEFDRDALLTRLRDPALQAHFARTGTDITALVLRHLDSEPTYLIEPGAERPSGQEYNSDLFAKDEFLVPFAR